MIPGGLIATEAEEIFYEIFFGTQGGWVGFIIIASIMILVTAKVKYAAPLFSIASIFMGVMMVSQGALSTDNNLWWVIILYFALPIFLILLFFKGNKAGF